MLRNNLAVSCVNPGQRFTSSNDGALCQLYCHRRARATSATQSHNTIPLTNKRAEPRKLLMKARSSRISTKPSGGFFHFGDQVELRRYVVFLVPAWLSYDRSIDPFGLVQDLFELIDYTQDLVIINFKACLPIDPLGVASGCLPKRSVLLSTCP